MWFCQLLFHKVRTFSKIMIYSHHHITKKGHFNSLKFIKEITTRDRHQCSDYFLEPLKHLIHLSN